MTFFCPGQLIWFGTQPFSQFSNPCFHHQRFLSWRLEATSFMNSKKNVSRLRNIIRPGTPEGGNGIRTKSNAGSGPPSMSFRTFLFYPEYCHLRWRHRSVTLPNPPWITFDRRHLLPSFTTQQLCQVLHPLHHHYYHHHPPTPHPSLPTSNPSNDI